MCGPDKETWCHSLTKTDFWKGTAPSALCKRKNGNGAEKNRFCPRDKNKSNSCLRLVPFALSSFGVTSWQKGGERADATIEVLLRGKENKMGEEYGFFVPRNTVNRAFKGPDGVYCVTLTMCNHCCASYTDKNHHRIKRVLLGCGLFLSYFIVGWRSPV